MTSGMDENEYEIPISFQAGNKFSCHSSEEDFVDVKDLPALPQWTSESHLFVESFSNKSNSARITPSQSRVENSEKESLNLQGSHLRRCTSSASYLSNKIMRYPLYKEERPVVNTRSNQSDFRRYLPPVYSKDRLGSTSCKPIHESSSSAYVVSLESKDTGTSTFGAREPTKPRCKSLGKRENLRKNQSSTNGKKEILSLKSNQPISKSLTPTRPNLRDSAIDLVSDDDSEAYTAISLAGTLTGRNSVNATKAMSAVTTKSRKFYIVIAILCAIILLLGGLGIGLALALFK